MKTYLIHIMLWFCATSLPSLAQNTQITIPVSGACGMCKTRIEKTAKNVIGVNTAVYDIDKQTLTISAQSIFLREELVGALLNIGHDADGLKAPDDVYNQLHACCHYRDLDDDHLMEEEIHEAHDGHDHSSTTPSYVIAEQKNTISGRITGVDIDGKELPLIAAVIKVLNANEGTTTNVEGQFELILPKIPSDIIVSYVGYKTDTFTIERSGPIAINLISENILDNIEITHVRRTASVNYLATANIKQITRKELLKAACCTLAESFETNAQVDGGNTDAISGFRKIEMLGLAGPYIQITRENMPDVRAMSSIQGLSFTPGPWIKGMQINMGAGSVVNGFESITGQINVDWVTPREERYLAMNSYMNQAGRYEWNYFSNQDISPEWSTATLAHLSTRNIKMDRNEDGFLDNPLGNQFTVSNRWQYTNGVNREAQLGAKATYFTNISGQVDFDPKSSNRRQIWGADMETQRVEVFGKHGWVDPKNVLRSIGLQASGTYHEQTSQYGLRPYNNLQRSLYFNSIFMSNVVTENHVVKAGLSFQYDNIDENIGLQSFKRKESVPGIYTEYTYAYNENFSIVSGIRLDRHNQYGYFVTPRLNVRYAVRPSTVLRLAGGRGLRTSNIFADNIGFLASNREIIIASSTSDTPYGLRPEIAWNGGTSITHEFRLSSIDIILSGDYNYIYFQDQVVVDYDVLPSEVHIYNLLGSSYAHSVQIQADIQWNKRFNTRMAYRYNNVMTTYGDVLLQRPLTSPHRAFLNLAFNANKGWSFDATLNWLSSSRIPSTITNPEAYRLAEESPDYMVVNTQIAKDWGKKFRLYVGVENLLNFRVNQPIIAANDPFSRYFDSSLIWGPIMGSNIYMGINFDLWQDTAKE